MAVKQNVRTFALLISIVVGVIFYRILVNLNAIIPYLLFAMLFLTFCKVDIKEVKINRLHVYLALFQVVASYGSYFIIRIWNEVIAQGVMSCLLAPTACAAVVVAGILGASIVSVTTYTLLINLVISVFAPLLFTIINGADYTNFFVMFLQIVRKVFPIIVLPMLMAIIMRKLSKPITNVIIKYSGISFYFWVVTVAIVIARTVDFVVMHGSEDYLTEIVLVAVSFVLCILQFHIGRRVGAKMGDAVAGGQSLGQKNAALMIWMVQNYLNPLASVACASYVVWQNIVNSYQMWRKQKKDEMIYVNN